MRHRPSISKNVKNWKVFEDEKQIHQFLTLTGGFKGASVDEENEFQVEETSIQEDLQNKMASLKEVVREEEPVFVDENKETKEEGVQEPKMQETKLQQGYKNNLCGK